MVVRAVRVLAPIASAFLWSGCSPYGGGAFHCTSDEQCTGGPDGKCEVGGLCSFADTTCPEPHRRYGELSGPNSNQCVGGETPDGGGIDIDAPDGPKPVDAQFCLGTGLVQHCFNTPPSGPLTISTAINTDSSQMCDQSVSTTECVIVAGDITVQGTVAATGNKPLVLLAANTIMVTGTLDVASHRGQPIGAGADMPGCDAPGADTGRGGGAGGSFGDVGGGGGNGAQGGTPGMKLTPTTLRGGCPGQNGAGGGGAGGRGGGAVYLLAGTSITVGGTINASGEGGGGAPGGGRGGGGGGSGGFIGLEAPTVSTTTIVMANGGGGGEGSGQGGGNNGADPTAPASPAGGGANGSQSGGNGGPGAAGATLTGTIGASGANTGSDGGGGGGGGAGIVRVIPTQSLGGSVSPSPT